MLSFDIRSLEAHAAVVDELLSADDPVWEESDRKPIDGARVSGRLSAAGQARFYWHGRMQGDVVLECSRCLDLVELKLAGKFEALYVPDTGPYASRMGRRDFEWGDQRVNFYSEATIDLADEIRECLSLELPLKPLCRPDCAGLCPQCGHNLNEGPCECKPDKDDDTWAALRKLIPPKP